MVTVPRKPKLELAGTHPCSRLPAKVPAYSVSSSAERRRSRTERVWQAQRSRRIRPVQAAVACPEDAHIARDNQFVPGEDGERTIAYRGRLGQAPVMAIHPVVPRSPSAEQPRPGREADLPFTRCPRTHRDMTSLQFDGEGRQWPRLERPAAARRLRSSVQVCHHRRHEYFSGHRAAYTTCGLFGRLSTTASSRACPARPEGNLLPPRCPALWQSSTRKSSGARSGLVTPEVPVRVVQRLGPR